ncbi:MAG: hypothetical protein Q7U38_18140, partial [Methylobacter sp.]|nr:hypothetical protein [Methylobacter sp.]
NLLTCTKKNALGLVSGFADTIVQVVLFSFLKQMSFLGHWMSPSAHRNKPLKTRVLLIRTSGTFTNLCWVSLSRTQVI